MNKVKKERGHIIIDTIEILGIQENTINSYVPTN